MYFSLCLSQLTLTEEFLHRSALSPRCHGERVAHTSALSLAATHTRAVMPTRRAPQRLGWDLQGSAGISGLVWWPRRDSRVPMDPVLMDVPSSLCCSRLCWGLFLFFLPIQTLPPSSLEQAGAASSPHFAVVSVVTWEQKDLQGNEGSAMPHPEQGRLLPPEMGPDPQQPL